jgi:hypothetical protein
MLNTDPDPDPIRIPDLDPIRFQGFVDQKLKKLPLKKKYFGSKTTIYLSLGLHKGRLFQKKPSALKREHPALQNMKFLNFFLLLWVIFALMDPDPLN